MSSLCKEAPAIKYYLRSRKNGRVCGGADKSLDELHEEGIIYVSGEGIAHLYLETTMMGSKKKKARVADEGNQGGKFLRNGVSSLGTQEPKPVNWMPPAFYVSGEGIVHLNLDSKNKKAVQVNEAYQDSTFISPYPKRLKNGASSSGIKTTEEPKPIYRMSSVEIHALDEDGFLVSCEVTNSEISNPQTRKSKRVKEHRDHKAQLKENNFVRGDVGFKISMFADSSEVGVNGSGISISKSGFGSTSDSETHRNPEAKLVFFKSKRNHLGLTFTKGHLWAFYDEFGMPRRYIRIDHSSGPGDSICASYLDYNEEYAGDRGCSRKASGALSACGTFTVYRKVESINASAISHPLPLSLPIGECTYLIYPRKGDVWAITGKRNLKLTPLHLGSPRIQMYQIVEVLEDYHFGIGTSVVYLVKVNGSYRSLFRRHVNEGVEVSFLIPMKELGRFSHQVPSFRLAGDEIVSGCLELDPSALPLHVENFKDNVDSKIDDEYLSMRFLDLKFYNRLVNFKYHTLWAVYDPRHRIPIKYAKINHSKSSESVVGMSWLEPDPTTEDKKRWYKAGLPIACGKFRSRETIDAQEDLVLSHPVPLKLLGNMQLGKYDCIIYPRTGDVWGIYKDWDMKWSCDSSRGRAELEYEIVEIDGWNNMESAVKVLYLVRVEGFKNLFRRKAKSGVVISFDIPKNDIYRFSHQIPAYRIRRKGDEEILEGSVVLDPQLMSHYVTKSYSFGQSSLSECLTNEERSREIQHPHLAPHCHVEEEKNGIELENQEKTHNRFEFSSTHVTEKMEKRKGTAEEVNLFPHEANLRKQGDRRVRVEGDAIEQETLLLEGETSDIFEQSNIEFHDLDNFDSSKNYELDQIWALYDDLDGMPRSYARINRFIPTELKLEVTLLEPHAVAEEELQWVMEENLPMSCGTFRSSTSTIIKEMPLFSHQVVCGEGKTVRRSFYKIFPRKGEIWAIYRDWDPNWTHTDIKNNLHYRMIEVVSDYTEESGVTVAGIIRVEGFRTIYQRHLHDGFGLFKQFSRRQLLRFSHRVPAVRLSGYEKNGVPTGSWKLNSAAVVTHYPS
ncbi:hypothetical protein HHK36_015931 [Tetracentron sinense]|uniref:DUF3444 domain-containing protein n=1 Tax=Tetracentron sinense TaxID=13715 RepID=A0A834ZA35_TETSI|nr:hypothetical protein HHK36_015931 [Tetracentron sinense]